MSRADTSLLKRVADLEQRLRAAEADLRLARQSPPSWAAPRERWLGRIAVSPTPSAGDYVYAVELLSVVYDDSAPGASPGISIHERGKTVNALAWPQAAYTAEQYVVVERIRGALSGDGYSGEWFLTQPVAEYTAFSVTGDALAYGWRNGDLGLSHSPVIGDNGYDSRQVKVFPTGEGVLEDGAGEVFAVNNSPGSYDDHWLTVARDGKYRLTLAAYWLLAPVDLYTAQLYLRAGQHRHGYGAGLNTDFATPEDAASFSTYWQSVAIQPWFTRDSIVTYGKSGVSSAHVWYGLGTGPYICATVINYFTRVDLDTYVDLVWTKQAATLGSFTRCSHVNVQVTVDRVGDL